MGQHPVAAAERRFRFELAAHPGSVAQARRLTRSRLSAWAVCEDTCDTAALVVSELVTNAIVHAAGHRVVCELHDAGDRVRIAVGDEGCAPGEPHPSPQRPDEEHGRGLLLVAAVSRAWGAQDTGPGLLVWAEIPRSADRAENTADAFGETRPGPGDGPDDRSDRTGLVDVDGLDGQDDRNGQDDRHGPGDRYDRHDPYAPHRLDAPEAGFGAGAQPAARLAEALRGQGPRDADTGPRADLGWSAKKPPNDGRGTGAEGSWGAGTVGNPQPFSAPGGGGDRDPRRREQEPYRWEQSRNRHRDRDRERL
ncbi:ATP-binding protein [Streptomyces sp. NPDC127038]|uniref:ATP-binding protein n=1 Tax=Streptomyces sp. NPDC127038 TaxID=3347114 RepID=UPI00364888BD